MYTHVVWNVGGRPEEATHPAIADVWRLYEATLYTTSARRRRRRLCEPVVANHYGGRIVL